MLSHTFMADVFYKLFFILFLTFSNDFVTGRCAASLLVYIVDGIVKASAM